ncbi:MAG: xanthine dehydrogenase family protein molybdopterin-binding subunit [Shewanellaceae bacterium]|nr:xanthine dehydrogenase family protein molybdopterin-binding subunit [Shewanellaceae bacterium]
MSLTRREFIKKTVIGGVAVYMVPLASKPAQSNHYIYPDDAAGWSDNQTINYRLDAISKVTGQKLYARDFRASDFQDWPKEQWHGYILRVTKADRPFKGLNIKTILGEHQPQKVITAKDLNKKNIKLPGFFGSDMLLDTNQTASYLGHAVAILLFKDYESYRQAKIRLQFNEKSILYGKPEPIQKHDPYVTFRYIRYTDGEEEKFSNYKDGLFFPEFVNHKPLWPEVTNPNGSLSERGMHYVQEINKEFKNPEWMVFAEKFESQIIEPMMLEAENGLMWYNAKKGALHCVMSIQDPTEFEEMAIHMIKQSSALKGLKSLYVHSGFIGGGFGAKDHSIFPYYMVAAMLFAKGHPVRIAYDRYEQFQAGLKRHPYQMHHQIAINKKTHQFEGVISNMEMDGGGRANFTPVVAIVSIGAIQGAHYYPRSDVQVTANKSRNVDAGSMRGFGSVQAMATLDMLINEAADKMKMNSIALRKKNVLQLGDANNQGAVPAGTARYLELLERAEKHPIWVNKDDNKIKYEQQHPNEKFGVGFSMLSKNYGTGAVAPHAGIHITRDGHIELDIEFIEMGQGAHTSQAVVCKRFLGQYANTVRMGVAHAWKPLNLYMTQIPWFMEQSHQDKMKADPRWTPMVNMPSSASDSAFFQSEATIEASRILYRHGLWPAALHIWRDLYPADVMQGTPFREEDAVWQDGYLTLRNFKPLPFKMLAMVAHQQGLVTGVLVHSFNRWAWVEADFKINGTKETYFLDAVALQYGDFASKDKKKLMKNNGYHLLDRIDVRYPATKMNDTSATYFAPCANLVELSVHQHTGVIKVHKIHSILDCGKTIVPQIVEGQMEGGAIMGLGHVLHEYLPPFEEGPGNGTWNLNRYHIPKASDVPVWHFTNEILPPLSPHERSKGIAEVVMLPIVSAVQEGIYQAIGYRFRDFPITKEKILDVLYPH